MMDQAIVLLTLLLALVLFVTGRWRYDVVAVIALLVVTVAGIVPPRDAFAGFGHPAVITVAAVLVVSRALLDAGLVDVVARRLSRAGDRPAAQILVLTASAAAFSAFINNVGALALLMPVAIRMARQAEHSPSLLLMPLAFGSLLGGLITLIGTPPNIIIATFRADTVAGEPFRMFDFAPVGLGIAVAGLAFITAVGWRVIPRREAPASPEARFEIENYLTEVRLPEDTDWAGKPLRDLEASSEEVTVVGLVRAGRRLPAPSAYEILRPGDLLIIQASSEDLQTVVEEAKLEPIGSPEPGEEGEKKKKKKKKKKEEEEEEEEAAPAGEDVALVEAVVMPDSPMVGKTANSMNLRWRHGINLLAVARRGARLTGRPREIPIRAGDVLLLQGRPQSVDQALSALGSLPLAERELRLDGGRRVLLALAIFGAAVATAAMGLLPVQIAFVAAALVLVLGGFSNLEGAYRSIDWPVIVLLGAMIPLGEALETTGTAQLIADSLLGVSERLPPWSVVALLLVVTMFLSDLVNNAAAAVLMAPIAIGVAQGLGASVDPFLMAVAVGASCAFLTPIGHQSNTLVMGPGGYEFGDYWRMGLPLEGVIAVVAVPLILWVWPL